VEGYRVRETWSPNSPQLGVNSIVCPSGTETPGELTRQ
jgi:hypothetical protein